jgi:hypothetical protein
MKYTREFPRRDPARDKHPHPRTPQHHASSVDEVRVQPQPLMDKCNPLCPLFRCGKDALFIVNKPIKGRILRVAQCRLTGGDCINGECQYAGCRINSLLPDGRCVKALEKRISRLSDEELIKQIQSIEDID